MRIDKFTQKMQEALQAAQDLASQSSHQEITNEHFLLSLLDQSDGITQPLLEKIGVQPNDLRDRLLTELNRKPKVTGAGVDLRLSNELRSVLDGAEKEMAKLKDEFVSAEHYLLALTNVNVPAALTTGLTPRASYTLGFIGCTAPIAGEASSMAPAASPAPA